MHANPFRTAALAFAALALAACASTPPPTDQLAVSRAAVDAAQRAGAGELAAVDLAQARAKLERAQYAMNTNNYVEARRLADEAAVDAELAQARAATSRAHAAAAQVDQSIRALREEIERSQTPAPTGTLGATPAPAIGAGVPR
jgi:hypothetical protein